MKAAFTTLLCATLSVHTLTAKETTVLKENFYQTVSGYILLNYDVSYEAIFKQKNGIATGVLYSNFMDSKVFNVRSYYRRYFDKENIVKRKTNTINGTLLKSWGPLIRYVQLDGIAYEDKDLKHNYTAKYLTTGLHIHKKRVYKSGFTIDTRIGYGFPFEIKPLKWTSSKPSEGAGLTADFVRGTSGLDIGVTLGFSF